MGAAPAAALRAGGPQQRSPGSPVALRRLQAMIKHQGRRVPSSVQAHHASAPAFQPVPPPPAPHLSSCSPLLWQQEQAQLHLQLPQLSRRPATNPFHPELPFPFRPAPPPASRSQALRVAAGPEGCSWELGTSLVTPTQGHFATFHMDPPSDACEQRLLQARELLAPRTAFLRPLPGTGLGRGSHGACGPGRRVPPGTAELPGSGAPSHSRTEADAAEAGGGRALGPQARSL